MRYAIALVALPVLLLTSTANAEHWYEAERNAYFSSVPANTPLRLRPPVAACVPSNRAAYYGPPMGSPYGPAVNQNRYVPNYLSNSYYTPGNYPVAPATPRLFPLLRNP